MAYVKKMWRDYPDTTTPILASDMNNIENGIEELDTRLNDEEMYVQATAGANGDFFVNLTNQTLVNGRIVKISFPAATNSSSNARLSIDGGTTYVNIIDLRDSVNLFARVIENKKEILHYNGTNWVLNNRPVQELLWSGSLATGDIALPKSCLNYNYLLIRQSTYGSLAMCPVLKSLTRITGITVFAGGSRNLEINAPRLTRSTDGMTLTINAVGRMDIVTTPTITYITTDAITEVWGVRQ